MKTRVTLKGKRMKTKKALHAYVARKLHFPDYYGKNWDACWDCLTDMVGDPIHIKLIGMECVQSKFPRHAQILLDILRI